MSTVRSLIATLILSFTRITVLSFVMTAIVCAKHSRTYPASMSAPYMVLPHWSGQNSRTFPGISKVLVCRKIEIYPPLKHRRSPANPSYDALRYSLAMKKNCRKRFFLYVTISWTRKCPAFHNNLEQAWVSLTKILWKYLFNSLKMIPKNN